MGVPVTKELVWERAMGFTAAAIEASHASG